MAPPVKPTAPALPLRSQPNTFSERAEAAIAYQFGDLPNWMETLAVFVEDQKEAAEAAAAASGAAGGFDLSGKNNWFFTVNPTATSTEFSSATNARLKMGAGTVGNPVFTADTQAQAHAAIGTVLEHIGSDNIGGAGVSEVRLAIDAKYSGFYLVAKNFHSNVADGFLRLQLGTGSFASPVWQTGYAATNRSTTGASTVSDSETADSFGVTPFVTTNTAVSNISRVWVDGMNESTFANIHWSGGAVNQALQTQLGDGYARQNTLSTRTVARLIPSSGVIFRLKYDLFGVRDFT